MSHTGGSTLPDVTLIRHQMNDNNRDMVQMLTQQMNSIVTPMIENNNAMCMMLAQQIGRLNKMLIGEPNPLRLTQQEISKL